MILTKLKMLQTRCATSIGTSIILIGITTPGLAYTPPNDVEPPRGPAIPGGRRGGCDDLTEIDLMALAPQQQAGQTISTRPTLTWFVPDETAYPLRLQIYKHNGSSWEDVVEDLDIGPSQQGFMSYTLPANLELEVGGWYRWHVVLICNPDRRSSDQVTGAEFEVVRQPAGLGAVQGDRVQQASQYAAAGLWYNAMAILSNASLTVAEQSYRRELLTELAEFEGPGVSEQLRLIAEFE
ncbi:MAG: DUF928 domain-containing protein [Cyanobacteria bacterium P01_A01_bin.123]